MMGKTLSTSQQWLHLLINAGDFIQPARIVLCMCLLLTVFQKSYASVHDEVFYYVDVKHFAKAEGSTASEGSIDGLIGHLPYVQSLGATVVWVSPIFAELVDPKLIPFMQGQWVKAPLTLKKQVKGDHASIKKLLETARSLDLKVVFDITPSQMKAAVKYGGCLNEKKAFAFTEFCPYLPSQYALNKDLQKTIYSVFAGKGVTQELADFYNHQSFEAQQGERLKQSIAFSGNQATGRIGYSINIESSAASPKKKLQRSILTAGYLFFGSGAPMILYGDEQGFTGGPRVKNENMFAQQGQRPTKLLGTYKSAADANFDKTHPIFREIQKFASVYKTHPALRTGIQHHRFSLPSQGIYAFSRIDPKERVEYLVAFNTHRRNKKVTLSATAEQYTQLYPAKGKLIKDKNGNVSINLTPYSFAVYKAISPLPMSKGAPKLSMKLPDPLLANDGVVEVSAIIEEAEDGVFGRPISLNTVNFEVRMKGQRKFTPLGKDAVAPYTNLWDVTNVNKTKLMTFRVTAVSESGEKSIAEQTVKVDARSESQRKKDEEAVRKKKLADIKRRQAEEAAAAAAALAAAKAAAAAKIEAEEEAKRLAAMPPPVEEVIYLRGEVVGSWDPLLELTYIGGGKYQCETLVTSGIHSFKFADEDWFMVNIGSKGQVLKIGQPVTLVNSEDPPNIMGHFKEDGIYRFTLEFKSLINPILVVDKVD